MRAASLFVAFCCALMLWSGVPRSDELSAVGMRQLEFRDADRELSLTLYYPAAPADDADLFTMPFYTGVALHRDAPLLDPQAKRPLVMFSHGRGSNALTYAWFGQYLAARGFIVAALDHYRANSYDATIACLANRMVPAHLRRDLPLDPGPALDVHDQRIKAAFAMAPGIIQAFGMDELGLSRMAIPAFLIVGARDTQTPPGPNAEFAAKHIPGATLEILPGLVDHEIFVNECNDAGRDEFPEACIDAAGVDRGALHRTIGEAAVRFFGTALK